MKSHDLIAKMAGFREPTINPTPHGPVGYRRGSASRAARRADDRYREARRRKGNRTFFEQARRREFAEQSLLAQLRIVEAGPEHPMYRNVHNALTATFGATYTDALHS